MSVNIKVVWNRCSVCFTNTVFAQMESQVISHETFLRLVFTNVDVEVLFVWESRFVYRIPESIESGHVGPLACAGASVVGVLYGYNFSPTSTVGIVGLASLDHMVIKFSKP